MNQKTILLYTIYIIHITLPFWKYCHRLELFWSIPLIGALLPCWINKSKSRLKFNCGYWILVYWQRFCWVSFHFCSISSNKWDNSICCAFEIWQKLFVNISALLKILPAGSSLWFPHFPCYMVAFATLMRYSISKISWKFRAWRLTKAIRKKIIKSTLISKTGVALTRFLIQMHFFKHRVWFGKKYYRIIRQ